MTEDDEEQVGADAVSESADSEPIEKGTDAGVAPPAGMVTTSADEDAAGVEDDNGVIHDDDVEEEEAEEEDAPSFGTFQEAQLPASNDVAAPGRFGKIFASACVRFCFH